MARSWGAAHQSESDPRVCVVIPARGGSKGVPGKNLRRVGGVPLVSRAVATALSVPLVDAVFVSTDDVLIADAATRAGADTVMRPPELATDEATSEVALLHACRHVEGLGARPAVLVFMQATSPFIDDEGLGRAIDRVLKNQEDVVFSAVSTHEYLWRVSANGAVGVNHDERVRIRRQERAPEFRETGAYYVMQWAGFTQSGHRFFGRIGIEESPARSVFEIDTLEDLALCRSIARVATNPRTTSELAGIVAVVTDFDGVHTDNRVLLHEDGSESVLLSRSDGLGVEMLTSAGVSVLILSKERNPVVAARANKLGVPVLQAVDDKRDALVRWIESNLLDEASVAFIGNDLNDIPAMRVVGWPVAVRDAHPSVLGEARIVLNRCGGKGGVREFAEMLIQGRGDAQ